jgi:phospholipid/cholesterol/gamma-HCH transport system permease protein
LIAVITLAKRAAWETQQMVGFSLRMVASLFGRPFYWRETMEQMYLIGVGSLFLIALTGLVSGQGFALAFSQELATFGAKDYLGRIMSLAIVRELGPSLAGLMIAARVASGITAEIGAMKSSDQLDAMIAFGIDPVKKIAAPRFIALLVMVPALTIVCDTVAIIGGWMVATLIANVTNTMYWANVKMQLTFGNMLMGLVKPFVFSLVIAFVSCYKGFISAGGTKGVGKATTSSVVISSILVLVWSFLITKILGPIIRGYM